MKGSITVLNFRFIKFWNRNFFLGQAIWGIANYFHLKSASGIFKSAFIIYHQHVTLHLQNSGDRKDISTLQLCGSSVLGWTVNWFTLRLNETFVPLLCFTNRADGFQIPKLRKCTDVTCQFASTTQLSFSFPDLTTFNLRSTGSFDAVFFALQVLVSIQFQMVFGWTVWKYSDRPFLNIWWVTSFCFAAYLFQVKWVFEILKPLPFWHMLASE